MNLATIYIAAYKHYNQLCLDNCRYDVTFKEFVQAQQAKGFYWGLTC